MNYDAVIIGGGLGGLTAGAKLAKAGQRVLLVEQHAVVGGCATTFRRKDFTVEVGLHEMDGPVPGDIKTELFAELGIRQHVKMARVPEFYRFVNGRVDVVVPDDARAAELALIERFPHEAKGIKRFFKTILRIRREIQRIPHGWKMLLALPLAPVLFPTVMLAERRTVGQLVDQVIDDEDLKLVLLANLGYYHDDPHTLSLLLYGAAQGGYYEGGGYYVKGGSQLLSNHLASVIRDNGGEVVLRHLVTEILVEGGRAAGIRYRRRLGKDAQVKEARAGCVIANAAVPNVAEQLLPPSPARDQLREKIRGLQVGPSLLTVYLGFSRPPRELGNTCYSTFVYDEGVTRLKDWTRSNQYDFDRRTFVFVDYSQIDARLAPPSKALGVICTGDRLEDWEGLDRAAYRARKAEAARMLLARLEQLVPGIGETIEYQEVATARTVKRFTLNPQGTAYGYAQIPSQVGRNRLSQRSPLPGLYFASAWSEPGHGFSGAMIGGYICAKRILKG